MHASDIAKIAASVVAGSLTYEAASHLLGGNNSLLDQFIAGGAASVAGGVVGEVMDDLGVSGAIDKGVGEFESLFGF